MHIMHSLCRVPPCYTIGSMPISAQFGVQAKPVVKAYLDLLWGATYFTWDYAPY